MLKRHALSAVTLPPKPACLLELLCDSRQEVLTTSRIIEELWDGNLAVAEQGIRQAVLRLRREIPDGDTDQPAVINIPRKGYKLRDKVEVSSVKTPKRSLYRNWAVAISMVTLACLIAMIWVLSDNEPSSALLPVVPVTLASGFEESPSVSADGQVLLYSAGSSDDFDIYQKNGLDEDAVDHLILEKPGHQGGMVWSPDGSRFAFLSATEDRRSDDVYVYDRATGIETFIGKQFAPKFSRSPYGLAWAPVGNVIAFTSKTDSETGFAIFLHDLDSQQSLQLTEPDYIDMHPAFSPDGKTLSYLRIFNPELSSLYSIDIESGEERALADDNLKIYGHVWLDQTTILASVWEQGFFYPYIFDVNSLERQRVSIAGNFKFPSSSQQDVLYVRSLIERQINVYQFDSGALIPEQPIVGIGNQRAPVVNSATGRIVFVSDRSGQNALWTLDHHQAKSRYLPVGKSGPDFVSISESGSLLIFRYKNLESNETELAVFDLYQQSLRTLPIQNPLEGIFAGDDRYVVYMVFQEDIRQLWLFDLSNDTQQLIAENVWAPLGADQSSNTLYYAKEGQLFAHNLDAGESTGIHSILPSINGLSTIANGRLYLFRRAGEYAQLIEHDLQTSEERVLGQLDTGLVDHQSFFTVNPETSRLFITVVGKNESDIYRMSRADLLAASQVR